LIGRGLSDIREGLAGTLALQTVALTKRFPGVLANDRIDFGLRKGEIHCLLGENGAGKTTLAECLYGTHRPDSGEIFVAGQPVVLSSPSDAIRLGIGMVHQHFVLVEAHTVLENIMLGAQGKGIFLETPSAERKLTDLCATYGVTLDINAKVWQLSVGEQQWVEILKALYTGVQILLLDEPTSVLTPQEVDRLFVVLQQMRQKGLSIVFITHKLKEVVAVSDRITVLRKGRLVDTVVTKDVTADALAKMMVGREIGRVSRAHRTPGDVVLEIQGLRSRGDRGEEALRGVSLSLRSGEIVGLAGVAGNGQRELFEVLTGLRKATGGRVLVGGRDVTNRNPSVIMSRGVGYIPEDRLSEGLVPDFSVAENLILGSHRNRAFLRGGIIARDRVAAFASSAVSSFEIATPSIFQATKTLSGGNLQKVILARELHQANLLLLANQPTRGLDVGVVEYVHRLLLDKTSEGVGILLASEDLDELLELCDRVAVIFNGLVMDVIPADDASIEGIGLLMAGVSR
jgi:ABC-type uncharacterized transport system ATPase subunit